MSNVLEKLKGQLIVSCQAFEGWPLYGPENMAKMAIAAEEGGAGGIRACWPDYIRAVRQVTTLPIVGIYKDMNPDLNVAKDVFITPTFEMAAEVIEAGCDVVALDCTARGRSYDDIHKIVEQIKKHYPGTPIMGDLSTLEEGQKAAEMGVDIVSSTLSGYTLESLDLTEEEMERLIAEGKKPELGPDYDLVAGLSKLPNVLVNAEGRYWEVGEARQAMLQGADMITIGSAITAPQLITKRFAVAVKKK